MNIWLLTGEYPPDYGGGIATYSYHTAQMLRERGHEVTVFAASEKEGSGSQTEELVEGIRVIRFGADQSPQSAALGTFARWSYDAALVLAEYCRKAGKPDVLESQEYLGMPYYILQRRLLLDEALRDIPVLVTAHTPLYLCHQYNHLPIYRFPGYWIGEMERFSFLAADEVVFPSHYLYDEVERDFPQVKEHSRVIYNPYQDNVTSITSSENSKRSGFLFTARIERRKGIKYLLSTFAELWESGLDEPLYLLGDDWYDELQKGWMSEEILFRYEKYIEAKLLLWEGKQPPRIVKQRLNQVRAMILPSLLENYPYAVLEAMNQGCPVIVSQSGGHAEMVEEGVSGYIFSHHNPGELADKIQTVLQLSNDEHVRIVTNARTRVKQISGYEVIAPQKEEALERVRERMKPRRSFPFLRDIGTRNKPTRSQTVAGQEGLLSVVIPFFNLGEYLEDALKPFVNLKYVPYEIIVVDDGSTDQRSLEVVNKLLAIYQFRLERTQNQGLAATRNVGAKLARGEFLAFLDADDTFDPLIYPWALKILRQYKNLSYMGCWTEYFGDAKGYWPTWPPEPPYVLVHNPINTGALVYRKADFLLYGMNDTSFGYIMEDYDSLLCMLENGCRGVVIPEPLFKYRVRSNSMFHTTNDSVKTLTYQKLVHKHERLYEAYAEEVLGLTNCNGPGYLFDNPTLWYPTLGYNDPTTLLADKSHSYDLTQVPPKKLLYFVIRSILNKPYSYLRQKFPWLTVLSKRL